MRIVVDQLKRIVGGSPNSENMASVVTALEEFGPRIGMDSHVRLAHYIAQIAHESGRFRYDREIWDGKGAQARYEGRKDLGNVSKGDGFRYRGRSPIQMTGRSNYVQFTRWCREHFPESSPPDFEAQPDLLNTDPWEGLAPLWFWSTRDLNAMADANDIRGITKRINGGYNGFEDRLSLWVRACLVLLDRKLTTAVVAKFQKDHGLKVDDKVGKETISALHAALEKLDLAPEVSVAVLSDVPSEFESVPVPKAKVWQERLRELGYYEVGIVNGDWGQKSVSALGRFCRENGISVVESPDEETGRLLFSLEVQPARVDPVRAGTTARDLKAAGDPVVQQGDMVKNVGKAVLGSMGLGTVVNGTIDLVQLQEGLVRTRSIIEAAGSYIPWIVGAGVGFFAWRYGKGIVKGAVDQFRKGQKL